MAGPATSIRIVTARDARLRRGAARALLVACPPATEVRLVGSTHEAADDLVRELAADGQPTFGIARLTLGQLAHDVAWQPLATSALARATDVGVEAVAARAAFEASRRGELPFLGELRELPGFPRALAATLTDLRAASIEPGALANAAAAGPDLAALLGHYEQELARESIADGATLYGLAADALALAGSPPTVLLDVAVTSRAVATFVIALARAAPAFLATVPHGDLHTLRWLAPLADPEALPETAPHGSLGRLRHYLFVAGRPPEQPLDAEVSFLSAPGEARECVEIARRIHSLAATGLPFDRIAVLLRAPEAYAAPLQSALRRAAIPAYFARGSRRPDPAGRAFLALLHCAAEGLSTHRFAEYLSLGQVPDLDLGSAPPRPEPRWEAPVDDALRTPVQMSLFSPIAEPPPAPSGGTAEDEPAAASDGTLRAPHRWEEYLVESAVIGSIDRWRRRLGGYEAETRLKLEELRGAEADAPRIERLERDIEGISNLRHFALPVVGALARFPNRARWAEWLDHLTRLAPMVLRRPTGVARVLAELHPLSEVGPVEVGDVVQVLTRRLTSLEDDPPERRYGRVFVAAIGEARGLTFAAVFLPGLAERVFPRKAREDPLLPDAARVAISPHLATADAQRLDERLLLHLAAGCAERELTLSYPRLDVTVGRPRVPSFYLLDVLRAITGRIRDFEAFERDVAAASDTRMAWPAPSDPDLAIDATEHDLAVLGPLLRARHGELQGRARYLLDMDPSLGRSLRTRTMRWRPTWSSFDGVIRPGPGAREALERHRLDRRAYSVTALQRFAACPYQFLLSTIHRLEPREEPVAIESMDPLTRGKLIHEVQADTLRALEAAAELPIRPERLAGCLEHSDAALDRVAAAYAERLVPAIPRVWQDEVEAIRADLRTWLGQVADGCEHWVPHRFELGFGFPVTAAMDPRSHPEPAVVAGGHRLHGIMDLVERSVDGTMLRVTDHKTGRDSTPSGFFITAGGSILQPLLYAIALEQILDQPVDSGRLHFCTTRGRFAAREVQITAKARDVAARVLRIVDHAVAHGLLLPLPRPPSGWNKPWECDRCDYQVVCGPWEPRRSVMKPREEARDLRELRNLP